MRNFEEDKKSLNQQQFRQILYTDMPTGCQTKTNAVRPADCVKNSDENRLFSGVFL